MNDIAHCDPLIIGVHGVGDHAKRTILPAIDQCSALTLGGVSTRNPDVLAEQCAKWSCPGWNSLEDMLADANIDVVFVATPIHQHAVDGRKVLLSGRHLWCEKAFTATADDSQALVELAAKDNLAVCVSLAPVFHSQFLEMKRALISGQIGKVRSISGHFAFPHKDSNDSRYDPEAGGGALLDVGYYPALAASILMDEIPTVSGAVLNHDADFSVDIGGSALLEFSEGVIGTAQWGYGRDYINELIVVGETGTLMASPAFSKPEHLPVTLKLRRQNEDSDLPVADCRQFVDMLSAFAAYTRDPKQRAMQRNLAVSHQRLIDDIARCANE